MFIHWGSFWWVGGAKCTFCRTGVFIYLCSIVFVLQVQRERDYQRNLFTVAFEVSEFGKLFSFSQDERDLKYIASKFQGEIGVLGELWTVMWSCKAGIVCRTASSDQPAGWHGYQGFSNIPLSPMALGKAPHRSACANQTTNVPEQREISCRQLDPGSPTTHGKGRTSRHNCVFCCCCVHVWLPMWPQESGQGKRGIFFYHNLICV